MNQHYTIQPVQNSQPKRYQVMFGSVPMSRPMAKKEAEQYMQMMLGNVDSVLAGWNGMNCRG